MNAKVAVFGATSAIAAEVARVHAERGDRLCLIGRDASKLDAVTRRLGGAVAGSIAADFDELSAARALVSRASDALGGLDTALIAHGLLGDQLTSEHDVVEAERIIRSNFTSAVALLIPLANALEERRAGRLGVISSVAGERGRPRNYTYGASKAALTVYLQGVRSRLYGAGVSVTTIKLGPVNTPMTATHAKNALFAEPGAVARDIVAAMDAKRAEVFVPRRWAAIMPVVRHTPEALFQRLGFLSGR
ncbi:MAG: SDR family NAD(P)-dependent oxidoreductase [Sorangiineae bacterium]|nr:SDR family NAD(P)-dependent oxidoreductase [Polyangiaceae bacterium]MEB2322086.1 SDR family NAD(P)-dependent oxidoreductase [Sorangiineae bacterium]